MTDFDVCLSSRAIKNIVVDKIQENFEFVVGVERYKCAPIIAEFLSPRICLSHSVDPSIAEFIVQNPDFNDEFKLFLSLGSGSTIRVTKANRDFFVSLSREFGNSTLYISLLEHFEINFICSQLHDSTTLDLFSYGFIGRISSNFYELIESQLDIIPVSVLFHILSHNLLKISSEDSLFSYISSRLCSDPEYSNLLQFVHFEYISSECVCCFLLSLPECGDRRLWESISRRLISRLDSVNGFDFPLKQPASVDGIISYLTPTHGGNVHDKGIVTITSKSFYSDDSQSALRNVADLTSDSYFTSRHEPGQWICWDFHETRVRPTHYTIKSLNLKSWVIESSLDGRSWTEIDRQMDNYDFRRNTPFAPVKSASFAVSNSTECCFIRLTQTGKNHAGSDFLSIRVFEVFGTLIESREQTSK
jgi:hypothetical protein